MVAVTDPENPVPAAQAQDAAPAQPGEGPAAD